MDNFQKFVSENGIDKINYSHDVNNKPTYTNFNKINIEETKRKNNSANINNKNGSLILETDDVTWESADYEIARICSYENDLKNFHGILKLSTLSSFTLAKKHFKELSLLIHPDKSSNVDASKAFNIIKEALTNFDAKEFIEEKNELLEEITNKVHNAVMRKNAKLRKKNKLLIDLDSSQVKKIIKEKYDKEFEKRLNTLIYNDKTVKSNFEYLKKLAEEQRLNTTFYKKHIEHSGTLVNEYSEMWKAHVAKKKNSK